MPRHEQVSPDEDLSNFYAEGDPTAGGTPAPVPSAAPLMRPPAPPTAPSPSAPPPLPASPTPMTALPTSPAPAPVANPTSPDPVLAAVLSFIFPGAGQLWCGQGLKGIVMLGVAMFTLSGCGVLSVLAAVDAYLIAQRKRRGETLGEWQMF